MNLRPLIIDSGLREEVARVMAHAAENLFGKDDILTRIEGKLPPVGSDPGFVTDTSFGYRIAFCIEEQTMGWTRHLSVSVSEEGKLPAPVVVDELMRLFGFRCTVDTADYLWIEEQRSINVLEVLHDDEDHRALHLAEPWRLK